MLWFHVSQGSTHTSNSIYVGIEQGGVNSDKIYKLCNNTQLSSAQSSKLGVDLGSFVISSIGYEDDAALMAHNLTKAEHVGILRSPEGNMPNILSRLSAHTMASVLPIGMAYSHRGNPAASLSIEKLYGTPVLLSGLKLYCLQLICARGRVSMHLFRCYASSSTSYLFNHHQKH